MFRTLFFSIILSSFLFSSTDFTVRLAVFKNGDDLKKMINKFPPALKKTVKIEKKGPLNYAYSLPTPDKKTLEKLLPAYRKFFPDAYIRKIKK